MAMNGTCVIGSTPASKTFAMCGVSRFVVARASRWKRVTRVLSSAMSPAITFTATRWPVSSAMASNTVPIPPFPRRRTTEYFPPIVVGRVAIGSSSLLFEPHDQTNAAGDRRATEDPGTQSNTPSPPVGRDPCQGWIST